MQRWRKDRDLMLARWRQEIALHGGHDGWQLPEYGYPVGLAAPVPPIVSCDDDHCHCFRGPGFFRKKRALGCSRPRCGLCKFEKYYVPKARHTKKLQAIRFELDAYGL